MQIVSPLVLAEVPGVRGLANESPGTACMIVSPSLQTLIRVGAGKIFPALSSPLIQVFEARDSPRDLVRRVAVL